VWASSREELFSEAAQALIAVQGRAQGDPSEQTVSLEAPDLASLFVDWLSEILYLFEVRRFVPSSATVVFEGDTALRATVHGLTASSFEQTGPAVKAITYHDLAVSDTDAWVYVDV
jgi:SHS2 domain-containing protein